MFANVKGVVARYIREGEGETVLILHGWGANIEVMEPLYSSLSKYYDVVVVDLPGFGRSDYPNVAWTIGDYVEFIFDFMVKLKISEATIIGHSFGGRIAIKLSATMPDVVKKLILIDSAGIRINNSNLRLVVSRMLSRMSPKIKRVVPDKLFNRARQCLYRLLGSTDYLASGRLRETFTLVIEEDLMNFLPMIKAETLLLWGGRDKSTPISIGKTMHRNIEVSHLVIFPKLGHFPFIDNPDDVLKEIYCFLGTALKENK